MIACYGEALVDLIVSDYSQEKLETASQACLGGSVFNFCLAAQRQGMASVYLNALSTDVFGRQFAHVMTKEGVLLDAEAPCHEPTSIAVVQLDATGKASYTFHRERVADTARAADDVMSRWRADVVALHTGCLMLTPSAWPQTRQIMAHAAGLGCVVSVDANLRPAACPDAAAYLLCVLQACAMAHIVKVSDDDLVELGWLAAGDAFDTQACVSAAGQFFDFSTTALVALTLGARGAWLLTRNHRLHVAAPLDISVVDTVGAGDSFAAALLAHLHTNGVLTMAALRQGLSVTDLQAALAHAVAAASLCVQRTGCDPATWAQTQAFADGLLG